MSQTPNYGLPLVPPNAADPSTPVNDALIIVDGKLKEFEDAGGGGTLPGQGAIIDPGGGTTGQVLSLQIAMDGTRSYMWVDPGTTPEPVGPDYGSYTVWQMDIPAGSGYFAYAFSELVFLDKDDNLIPMTGVTILASSTSPGSDVNNLKDNNINTFWASNAPDGSTENVKAPEWLRFTFPSAVAVTGLRATARNDSTDAAKQVPSVMESSKQQGGSQVKAFTITDNVKYGQGETRTYNTK